MKQFEQRQWNITDMSQDYQLKKLQLAIQSILARLDALEGNTSDSDNTNTSGGSAANNSNNIPNNQDIQEVEEQQGNLVVQL